MPKKQLREIDKAELELSDNLDVITASLVASLSEKSFTINNVEKNVDRAFKRSDTIDDMEKSISKNALANVNIGRGGSADDLDKIKNPDKVLDTIIRSTYGKQKRPLYKTLRNGELQSVVSNEIKNQLIVNRNWKKTAYGIKDNLTGDLPKYIDGVITDGRRVFDNPEAYNEFRRSIKRAQANIKRLVDEQATGTSLKKNYESIISAVEQGSKKSFELAVSRAVNKKMRYNAERIAISESSFNYGQSVQQKSIDDPIVGALEFFLDPSHPKTDECDTWASADMFGLGPGIYPIDQAPTLPIHPNGKSLLFNVSVDSIKGKTAKYSKESVEKYLKSNPRNQKAILGVDGAKQFRKNPGSWEKHAKNLAKPPKFKPYLPE